MDIRAAAEAAPDELLRYVVENWHSESVIAHDESIFPAQLPGFIAVAGDRIVGHVSYRIVGGRCEITSVAAARPQAGTGTRLLQAAIDAVRASGCHTLWLTTTNDNLDALRFYQRLGFRLSALRSGAVDRARLMLKPEMPSIGSYGSRCATSWTLSSSCADRACLVQSAGFFRRVEQEVSALAGTKPSVGQSRTPGRYAASSCRSFSYSQGAWAGRSLTYAQGGRISR